MREATFCINEKPVVQARHRIGKGRTYNPVRALKLEHRDIIRRQMEYFLNNSEHLFCGPIRLSIKFFMPLPSAARLKKTKGFYHIQKPDLDNLLKFIMDVMSGIVYADDAYVCSIKTEKLYSNKPRTEIEIKELLQEKIDWNIDE